MKLDKEIPETDTNLYLLKKNILEEDEDLNSIIDLFKFIPSFKKYEDADE